MLHRSVGSVPLEEGKTEYSATVSNLYCTKLMNLGYCSAAGGDATTEIKITSVVINNKYTFTVNKVLQPATSNHDLANIWNADGFVAVVPYVKMHILQEVLQTKLESDFILVLHRDQLLILQMV